MLRDVRVSGVAQPSDEHTSETLRFIYKCHASRVCDYLSRMCQHRGRPKSSTNASENVYSLVQKQCQSSSKQRLYRSKVSVVGSLALRKLWQLYDSCMTSNSLQYDGRLDVKSFSFGARDLRPFAAMGLPRGVVTAKPEEYLQKYTGYANMSRGRSRAAMHVYASSIGALDWQKHLGSSMGQMHVQAPKLCKNCLRR